MGRRSCHERGLKGLSPVWLVAVLMGHTTGHKKAARTATHVAAVLTMHLCSVGAGACRGARPAAGRPRVQRWRAAGAGGLPVPCLC